MNCKPGDLAYHIGGEHGVKSTNLGKIVRVLRFVGEVDRLAGSDRWEIEGAVNYTDGSVGRYCRDKWLRPIRPDGTTDSEVKELYRAPSLPVKEQA